MLDMTDYESDFASWAEMPGEIQFTGIGQLMEKEGWGWPMTHSRIEFDTLEALPVNSTGRTHREGQEARAAEAEEEEEEDEDDDDDDDEDEDEDEEGGDDEEEEEEDEDEELEDEDQIPANWRMQEKPKEDRFFRFGENMWNSYNEVELDNFMKLLNIKPIPQWQDETVYHYKAGVHAYEDESQELDPYFHLLAEVERKHVERQQALKFRRGSEVKIVVDQKKMPVYGKW